MGKRCATPTSFAVLLVAVVGVPLDNEVEFKSLCRPLTSASGGVGPARPSLRLSEVSVADHMTSPSRYCRRNMNLVPH